MTEDKQGAAGAASATDQRCPFCECSDHSATKCPRCGCYSYPADLAVRPPSADHPGGPLSRAERVVLSNLKGGAMRARAMVGGMSHILGAIPGAQKIEAAHVEAVAAIDRLLMTMKLRKQGAPYPPGDPWGDASEGEPSDAVSAADPEAR